MTGGLVAYFVAAYEHVTGHSLSAFVWVTLGAVLFMAGAFLAWNEQFNKAILAGNPEILIEYEKRPMQIVGPALIIKNLGGGNAYRVKIRNITNGSALVVFNEVSHLEGKQTCEATATFENFTVPTPFFGDNFAAFLRTMVDWKRDLGAMQAIEQDLAPRTIKVIVDYFNVSDVRFTAEFEIRSTYAWEEAHTFLVRRYFNPAKK
jgi:hypothetical protein